jgi:hypothetical protein
MHIADSQLRQTVLQPLAVGKSILTTTHAAAGTNIAKSIYPGIHQLLEEILLGESVNADRENAR